MEAAKQMAAIDNSWDANAGPSTIGNPYYRETCSAYLRSGERPECPTGAACLYNRVNESATCESGLATHVLR